MPSDSEIKQEILSYVEQQNPINIALVKSEINVFESKQSIDGKSLLQKFHSQWKSGKAWKRNLWQSWAAHYVAGAPAPTADFCYDSRRAFARPSPPDIDSDFDHVHRHLILAYLVHRYG